MRILELVRTASVIGLLLVPCVPAGWGFEVDTHGRISQSAYVTTRDHDGTTLIHFIYFLQDVDGLWKIVAM